MNKEILDEINRRGISRLCHFTKAKNIPYILNDFNGILPTDGINQNIIEM